MELHVGYRPKTPSDALRRTQKCPSARRKCTSDKRRKRRCRHEKVERGPRMGGNRRKPSTAWCPEGTKNSQKSTTKGTSNPMKNRRISRGVSPKTQANVPHLWPCRERPSKPQSHGPSTREGGHQQRDHVLGGVEKPEPSHAAGGGANGSSHFEKPPRSSSRVYRATVGPGRCVPGHMQETEDTCPRKTVCERSQQLCSQQRHGKNHTAALSD